MTETKSVFLYGIPTGSKMKRLMETQKAYATLINRCIEQMAHDTSFLLDLLNNNKHAPKVRKLEKQLRSEHTLGSAYGQNAIDAAVKELHNHFIRIRNRVYGYIQQHHPEMEKYISYKSLLNASVLGLDEINMVTTLIENERSKKKPSHTKVAEYIALLHDLRSLSEEKRSHFKDTIATLFLERLAYSRLPWIKNAPLQLDSRLSTIEDSHSTKEDYIVYVKLLGEKERVAFPVSTSRNGRRRMKQYKTGSLTITARKGKVRISIPFTKKVKKKKGSKENILSFDAGVSDLIHTNTGNAYGTFEGMSRLYEEMVEPKLKKRSSLRNKMKEYQKQLKRCKDGQEKERLRTKISHIAISLNGNKILQKQRRCYAHEVDVRIHHAVDGFINEAKKSNVICVYEDLDMTEFDRGKKNNKRDSMWVRGQLIKKIQSKLDWMGIPHIAVDPAYTSKMCPKCSNVDDHNRKGKSFVCTVCKHQDDADHNAAVNIEHRAFDYEIHDIVEKFSYHTKKRHKALKELFEKRHRSYIEKGKVA
jgi:IS605 OrfB family transposase